MLPRLLSAALLVALVLPSGGCLKKIAVNALADQLAGGTGGAFTEDDDIAFVGDALPFTLKLMETVHASAPDHQGLALGLCSGFTQYAVVYVLWPAEQVKETDIDAYEHGAGRARNMLRRAANYCFEGLELRHPGFRQSFVSDADAALAGATPEDVPLLYWAGAANLARISLSKEDPAAIGELPSAAAMAHRALALDDTWGAGTLHELLVQLEPSLPMPGGVERARTHYQRALELSGGKRASVYVALATAVSIPAQDRAEFTSLLEKALAIDPAADPENELATLYAQEEARFYLGHADDLFVE
jgi:tetratricopeptide (TPR) repeat protein